jgi:hypothetical protein
MNFSAYTIHTDQKLKEEDGKKEVREIFNLEVNHPLSLMVQHERYVR